MRLVQNVVRQRLHVGDALLGADDGDKEGALPVLFNLAADGGQGRLDDGRALVVGDGHGAQPVGGVGAHDAGGLAERIGEAEARAPVGLLHTHGLLQ